MTRRRLALRAPILALLPLLLSLGCGATTGSVHADEVAVQVNGVGVDPRTQSPVILLEEEAGEHRTLPIWIGFAEARSIAASMEGIELPRPNTHDLAKRLIRGLDATLERVVVTELRENTYYALIVLRMQSDRIEIDSRPSDAIAIALRFEAPVFVREEVFGSASDDEEIEEPEPAGEPI